MLSASSPTDTRHRLNRLDIQDEYPFHYEEDLHLGPEEPGGPEMVGQAMVDHHRALLAHPLHRFFHAGFPPPLHGGHVKRVGGIPLRLELPRGPRGRFINMSTGLPTVPMIKGLVMRRQFRRDIHIRTLSCLLGQSFVALEWFRYERTVCLDPRQQIAFEQGMR
jgi:hypothetical protein